MNTSQLHKISKNRKGLSLMELMLAAGILAFCLLGFLAAYVGSFTLSATARSFTLAANAAQAKLEELRNSDYNDITTSSSIYTNTIYTNVAGFNSGWATLCLNTADITTDPVPTNIPYDDLKRIRIVVCWKEKGNRFIGEDNGRGGGVALDGVLSGSEDTNSNGLIDSPVEFVCFIAKGQ